MSRTVHKFGRNPAVGNGTWENVWTRGGAVVWPTAGAVTHVFSDDAADTSTGLGAQSVTVQGLSTAWADESETIPLAGASTAVGLKKFIRVNRAFVQDAGAYGGLFTGGNRGTITVNNSSGLALASIESSTGGGTVAFGQTQVAHYTVPAGLTAFVREITVSVNATKPADLAFFQRRNADTIADPFTSPRLISSYDGLDGIHTLHDPKSIPLGAFPERTDLWFATLGDGNATSVSVDFEIALYVKGQEPEFG
jgi:hypothetical protein